MKAWRRVAGAVAGSICMVCGALVWANGDERDVRLIVGLWLMALPIIVAGALIAEDDA